jgi:hypothetical protein
MRFGLFNRPRAQGVTDRARNGCNCWDVIAAGFLAADDDGSFVDDRCGVHGRKR